MGWFGYILETTNKSLLAAFQTHKQSETRPPMPLLRKMMIHQPYFQTNPNVLRVQNERGQKNEETWIEGVPHTLKTWDMNRNKNWQHAKWESNKSLTQQIGMNWQLPLMLSSLLDFHVKRLWYAGFNQTPTIVVNRDFVNESHPSTP